MHVYVCAYKGAYGLQQEAELTPSAAQPAAKAGAKKAPEGITEASSLALGPFTLQPATATLAVGAKHTVSVNFAAQGAQLSLQQIGMDISDR